MQRAGQGGHALGRPADPHGEPDPGAVRLHDRLGRADRGGEPVCGRGGPTRIVAVPGRSHGSTCVSQRGNPARTVALKSIKAKVLIKATS